MGSEEGKPSLEAPSLGFRRRKSSRRPRGGEPSTEPASATVDHTPPTPPGGDPSTEPAPTTVDHTPPTVVLDAPKPTRAPRRAINGHLAAILAGLVVGTFLVLATLAGLQGCESVRGTSSCGGGPGLLLLVLILVVAVLIGAGVLRWAQVPSPGSISFLAVALVAVVSALFLLDALDTPAGAVVVAALSIASYALAHWVTVRYIDTAGER